MKLHFLETVYSVCQLAPDTQLPSWAERGFAVVRTPEEVTIVVDSSRVPDDTKAQHGFACFRVIGALSFDEVGVIASISKVLASAEISILSISTYDTDYFLVPDARKSDCVRVLEDAGFEFVP